MVIVDTNLETLGQFSPGCRSDELTAPACLQGIHAFCATQGCATTGFGPIGLEDDTITVACVADTVPLATDFARLGAVTGETCFAANQYDTSGCARAYDRYCMAEGHPSGFGPVQVDGEVLQLSCLTRSTAEFLFSYGDLKAEVDECNVRDRRGGRDILPCNEAFHRLCVTEGYLSGFGPTGVDSDEEVARATCLGDLAP